MPLLDKLTGLFASGAAKVVDSIGDAIDKNITNKEEAALVKLAVEKEVNRHIEAMQASAVEAMKSEDNAITERWKADMASDNWASKYTRPFVMISLLVFLYIIIITDSIEGIKFEVKTAYSSLLESLVLTAILAYFGSRGVEKWKSMHEAGKK